VRKADRAPAVVAYGSQLRRSAPTGVLWSHRWSWKGEIRAVPPTSDQDKLTARRDQIQPTPAPDVLDLVLDAVWVAPSIVRTRVRDWLDSHKWPQPNIDELVLAVSEAVSNSIEHGYGISADSPEPTTEVVEIHSRIETNGNGFRQAVFTIRDHGTWRAPTNLRTTRGHGMLIMHTCADEVSVNSTDTGTSVRLRSHPVPNHENADSPI
jgi:anti-sigma regulatory factor (Ser/Thr protein kinase)